VQVEQGLGTDAHLPSKIGVYLLNLVLDNNKDQLISKDSKEDQKSIEYLP
jgi:hypothetical protein